MKQIFSIKYIQQPPYPTIPEPHIYFSAHSMRSDCLRKIPRLKKYFFLATLLFTTEVLFC